MSKRSQQEQGGGDRYGAMDSGPEATDKPQRATAAQMARRTIASARKPSGSQRSSRAGTPTAFGQQGAQQSMPSFQLPGQSGAGFGGDFSFSANAASNPFAQTNGAASSTPPPTFQFGTQQNGGSTMFGNSSASFGSTLASGNTQPQQNGFNPSTTMFGQNQNDTNKNSSSSIFSFGQANQSQPQPNGTTPNTNNSFPSFGQQNNENPFKSFGQTQQQTQSTANTSFNSFGQAAQPNGDKTPSTPFTFGQTNAQQSAPKPLFGSTAGAEQTPKTATGNVFANFTPQGQQNGDKSLFMPNSQIDQTPKPSAGGLLGGLNSTAKPLFGATPPPESASHTPPPGESIFGSLNQPKKDGVSANMFTQSREQTPKPTTNDLFGAVSRQPQQSESNAAEQTPKLSNVFGASNQSQPNGTTPSLFSNTSASQTTAQTPKPGGGLFSGGFSQQTPQQTAPPAFKFGQSQQDTSMTTSGNTPQKQSGSAQAAPQQAISESSASAVQLSSGQGGGLFDHFAPRSDSSASAQKPSFQPSASLLNTPTATSAAAKADSQKTPGAQGSSLFNPVTPHTAPATAFKPSFTPSTSLLNKPSELTAAPWISHAPTPANELSTQQPMAPSAPSHTTSAMSSKVIPDSERKTLRVLNEGLMAHLAMQNPETDWTPILKYGVQQTAKILKKPEPTFEAPHAAIPAISASNTSSDARQPAAAPTGAFASQSSTSQPPSTPATASKSQAIGSFAPKAPAFNTQQTPRPSGPSSLSRPPETAPINRKRPAEDDVEAAPATEKRIRANEPTAYPKLPDNASETAKLFQAALDKSNSTTPAFLKSTSQTADKQTEKMASNASEKNTTEGQEKEKQNALPQFGGFKPSTTGFTPSIPSGMPTFSAPSAGSNSFLASFGKKASAEEEKERKKRKMEDYDSDEETEEAWAERDRTEQEAKRQKILDAAKAGAGFTPSAGTTPAPESDIGEGSEKGSEQGLDTDSEGPAGPSKSLFERVTPRDTPATTSAPSKTSLFVEQTPSTSKPTSNLFAPKTPSGLGAFSTSSSSLFSKPRESIETPDRDKTEAEKDVGAGDNTWKPNTPIKFGGTTSAPRESNTPAAPPPLGNLFGTITQKATTESNGHLPVPKPTFGFNFGGQPASAATSRATTPGVTTDGEGASTAGEEAEEDEHPTQSEPQVEDQTGLRESEKENEDLLFTVHMAKAMKYGERKNDEGEIAWGWVDKGKGPLYILKHKESGKVRVVLKVPPYGTPRMNFEPLKNMAYEVQGGSGKMVQGAFVDHMDDKNPGKITKWLVQVGKTEDAKEMAKVLMDNRPNE